MTFLSPLILAGTKALHVDGPNDILSELLLGILCLRKTKVTANPRSTREISDPPLDIHYLAFHVLRCCNIGTAQNLSIFVLY